VADNKEVYELSRPVDLDRLGPAGMALEVAPTESERRALSKRFGFVDLPELSARLTVTARAGGTVAVEGRLRGRLVQACVLTLEPVRQDLDEPFRLLFKPGMADPRDPETGEAVLSAGLDAPEPLEGQLLDVGEIVAEQLALVADPYPRRPGVKLEDVLPKRRGPAEPPPARRTPFAKLQALKDRPRRGR